MTLRVNGKNEIMTESRRRNAISIMSFVFELGFRRELVKAICVNIKNCLMRF